MPELSRRQFAVSLVAVVLVVLLGGRALRADAGGAGAGAVPAGGFTAQPLGEPGTGASGTTGASGVEVTTTTEKLLVDVTGAVRRPGVYELPSGARIADALARAGGERRGADLELLNLAAKVSDGQQVLVPRRSARVVGVGSAPAVPGAGAAPTASSAAGAAGAGTAGGATGGPVDVNTADATQLETLNGVGPAIAAKIIAWRTQNGPFTTVEDLGQVSGIGPKKLEAMRAQVTL